MIGGRDAPAVTTALVKMRLVPETWEPSLVQACRREVSAAPSETVVNLPKTI